jgi:hypothetical protein
MGRRIAFKTWVQMVMAISGALGRRITVTPMMMMRVKRV